jgi:hypothetical protein
MRVNLGLGLYGEDFCPGLSAVAGRPPSLFERRRGEGGRDSVKVAQYEVLGNDAKRDARPAGDDRNIRLLGWRWLQ